MWAKFFVSIFGKSLKCPPKFGVSRTKCVDHHHFPIHWCVRCAVSNGNSLQKKCWMERHEDEFSSYGGAMKHKKRPTCKPCSRAPDGYLKAYKRRRYATDPAFRVLQLTRSRLYYALKGKQSQPAQQSYWAALRKSSLVT